ncbi:MAG: hypothetical protein EXS64_08250 [Candidatus Latescibacteria bacterium]|nr:hypothetical protein [Candidatus Latescibacterota bacterium]
MGGLLGGVLEDLGHVALLREIVGASASLLRLPVVAAVVLAAACRGRDARRHPLCDGPGAPPVWCYRCV